MNVSKESGADSESRQHGVARDTLPGNVPIVQTRPGWPGRSTGKTGEHQNFHLPRAVRILEFYQGLSITPSERMKLEVGR